MLRSLRARRKAPLEVVRVSGTVELDAAEIARATARAYTQRVTTSQVCAEHGCPNIDCTLHTQSRARPTYRPSPHPPERDTRPTAAARGYDHKWRRTRGRYLQLHPTCEHPGCELAAYDVHHLDGKGPLGPAGHTHSNLQALCHSHHSSITASTTNGRRT